MFSLCLHLLDKPCPILWFWFFLCHFVPNLTLIKSRHLFYKCYFCFPVEVNFFLRMLKSFVFIFTINLLLSCHLCVCMLYICDYILYFFCFFSILKTLLLSFPKL
jgi:hypothetical protein